MLCRLHFVQPNQCSISCYSQLVPLTIPKQVPYPVLQHVSVKGWVIAQEVSQVSCVLSTNTSPLPGLLVSSKIRKQWHKDSIKNSEAQAQFLIRYGIYVLLSQLNGPWILNYYSIVSCQLSLTILMQENMVKNRK